MGRLQKLYDRISFWRRTAKPSDTIEVPPSWPKGRGEEDIEVKKRISLAKPKKPFKIRVPGLRLGKRVLAFLLLVANFFLSQATLVGPAKNIPIALFFFANCAICIDYLWKTRRKTKLEQ